ncbi:MAG TPA: HAMP domain-containing sensor histidine kinase, partial [Nitrolancea sp.]|nr:HAMP domain-containing sensor histidine kinase [Nitrolancea sp.]
LTLWRTRPEQPYAPEDQDFLLALASRAALAVENARLIQQLQQAVQAREEFLSIAAHELKTPMTTVKGFAALLVDQLRGGEPDPEIVQECGDELRAQVDRFETLVNDLLDASRAQRQRLDLHVEPLDLTELAVRVVARFQRGAGADGHRVALSAGEPVEGVWDPDRLDQVLTNLLSNAVKYSPEGSEIRVAVWRHGDQAALSVSDHGIGMSPDEQARLFTPFVRTSAARQTAPGTGLGLYISRQILEQHGGSIEVESAVGAGTTMVVRLPIRREPATDSDAPAR